ncbi:hypothetical protein H4R20_006607, partial [Coemansia guatemalensis]
MHIAGLPNLFVIRGAAQFAGFEAEYMYTAYTNCVKLQFGNMLRHVVNVLVHADTDIQALRRRMGNQSEDEIQRAIKAEVRQPINRLKESLQFMRADDRMHSASTIAAREQLQPLFDLYGMLPALPDEGIYYDAVANPIGHLGGYYTLAKILKDNGHRPFQCFPLRTGWIPAHITVDATIARCNILNSDKPRYGRFRGTWAQIVKLSSKPFHTRNGCKFRGTVKTNGVTVSIVKSSEPLKTSKRKATTDSSDDIEYVHNIPQEELCQLRESMVFADPGRRQLFYAMGENSTSDVPMVFRSTAAEHMRTTKKQQEVREKAKTDDVHAAERDLATVSCHALNLGDYEDYIRKRAEHWKTMSDFYANTKTIPPNEDHRRQREERHQKRHQEWKPWNERQQQQQERQQRNQEKQRNGRMRQQLIQEEHQDRLDIKREHGAAYRRRKHDL